MENHKFSRAALPLGVAFAALAIVRLVLMLAGVVSAHPVDVIFTLGNVAIAVCMIRLVWEYRRTREAP